MFAIAVQCLVIGTLVGRLRLLALHDTLTGLPNRRLLEETLTARVNTAGRDGRGLAVAAVDLDELKRVKDTEGHAAGDRLLRSAAAGWTSAVRAGDSLARVGGDEFVLVLVGHRSRRRARGCAPTSRRRASGEILGGGGLDRPTDR